MSSPAFQSQPSQHAAASPIYQPRPIAVLGSFRGGTSATCGVLRKLGVFVGNQFWHCGYGTYEAMGLRASVGKCFDCRNKQWAYVGNFQSRVEDLRSWINFARREAIKTKCDGLGGKNPLMCMLVDELAQAWQCPDGTPPLFVSVERPKDEILANWDRAMKERGWFPRKDRVRMVSDLLEKRDEALGRYEHVRLPFRSLREDPRRTITRLANDCGLPLHRVDQAVASIRTQ